VSRDEAIAAELEGMQALERLPAEERAVALQLHACNEGTCAHATLTECADYFDLNYSPHIGSALRLCYTAVELRKEAERNAT